MSRDCFLCLLSVCLLLEDTLATRSGCESRRHEIDRKKRRCRRPCRVDSDCSRKKTCNCDGICGMSCYNAAAKCVTPPNIPNGIVLANNFTMQSTARYFCNPGYASDSDFVTTCSADKKWHPDPPKCIEKVCKAPWRTYRHILSSEATSWHVGDNVTATCARGYAYPVGSYTDTVTCTDMDTWSGRFSECGDIQCSQPPAAPNNYTSIAKLPSSEHGLWLPRSTVTYTCQENYVMSLRGRIFRELTSTCQYDEHTEFTSWTENLEEIACEADVNCTFFADTCGYEGYGWKRVMFRANHYMKSRLDNATLVSPIVTSPYALDRHICITFLYSLNNADSRLFLEFRDSSLNHLAKWSSHPHERKRVWISAFWNVAMEHNAQYQFRAVGIVEVDNLRVKRRKCVDSCEMNPCKNNGSCVSHLDGFTCFCPVDVSGKYCEIDIKCIRPPIPGKFASRTDVDIQQGVFVPGSTVTYRCTMPGYKMPDRQEMISEISSACAYVQARGKSTWNPSLTEIFCIPDVNCTFSRDTCGYGSRGWERETATTYVIPMSYMTSRSTNATLISPILTPHHALDGFVCVTFRYSRETGSSLVLELIDGVINRREFWSAHPREEVDREYESYWNVKADRDVQFQFRATGTVWLVNVEIRRGKCYDRCEKNSCKNGGTCVNRLNGITCLCTAGYGGEECKSDIRCNDPPVYRNNTLKATVSNTAQGLLLPKSTVTYKCVKNYKASGQENVVHEVASVCTDTQTDRGSEWRPPLYNIACEEVTCKRPLLSNRHSLSTNQSLWHVGETVTARCKHGYRYPTWRHTSTVTCTDSETWNKDISQCEANVNCTFFVGICGYVNHGWERLLHVGYGEYNYKMLSRSANATLVSPIITPSYALDRYICVTFVYTIYDEASLVLEFSNSSLNHRGTWSSHPQEKYPSEVYALWNVKMDHDVQYQFRAVGKVKIDNLEVKRWKCVDKCETNPCQNDGTCVNRWGGFKCFCAVGFIGKYCEIDVKCVSPPPAGNLTTRTEAIKQEFYVPGSMVTYRCSTPGYKISGRPELTSKCKYIRAQKRSTWIPPLTEIDCTQTLCKSPWYNKKHILSTNQTSWRVGETVSVSCLDNFEFEKDNFTDTATCTESGRWDKPFTKCEARCQPHQPPTPVGGWVNCSNSNLPRSICRFYCARGLVLRGVARTRCKKHGKRIYNWGSASPKCVDTDQE